MASENTKGSRKLNVSGIKKAVVFVAAMLTGVGSGVTGLGAQMAYAPMLTWMLGFRPDKALGTAMRYATIVALAALLGAFSQQTSHLPLLSGGLLLFAGATLGAIFCAKFTPKPEQMGLRQIYLTVGVGLMVWVIIQTSSRNLFTNTSGMGWNSPAALFVLGVISGGLTQALALPGGLLLVPGLHFLSGFKPVEAIVLSLAVVLFASLLPAWSYAKKGLWDETYGFASLLGGMIGGLCGGALMVKIGIASDKWLIYIFAVISMFLCARELARLAYDNTMSN